MFSGEVDRVRGPRPRAARVSADVRAVPADGGVLLPSGLLTRSVDVKTAPKPTRAEHKRAQIRYGAYRCFKERGYHDTTVDQICQYVGISKGSFYWHYPSKQEVFIDILEVWSREITDALYEQFEDAVITVDYERAISRALLREIRRGRAIAPLWLEFTVLARRDGEVQAALSKFYRRARLAIAEMLRPVMEPRFGEAQLRSVATNLFGAYIGLLVQEVTDPVRVDATKSVEEFMEVVGVLLGGARGEVVDRHPGGASRAGRRSPRGPSASADGGDDLEAGIRLLFPEAALPKVNEIRRFVREAVPEVVERLRSSPRGLSFRTARELCSLRPIRAGLRLHFPRGAFLPDPDSLLRGRGKSSRYVEMSVEDSLSEDALKALIAAALVSERSNEPGDPGRREADS